jgi:hypothetical protein
MPRRARVEIIAKLGVMTPNDFFNSLTVEDELRHLDFGVVRVIRQMIYYTLR